MFLNGQNITSKNVTLKHYNDVIPRISLSDSSSSFKTHLLPTQNIFSFSNIRKEASHCIHWDSTLFPSSAECRISNLSSWISLVHCYQLNGPMLKSYAIVSLSQDKTQKMFLANWLWNITICPPNSLIVSTLKTHCSVFKYHIETCSLIILQLYL